MTLIGCQAGDRNAVHYRSLWVLRYSVREKGNKNTTLTGLAVCLDKLDENIQPETG